MRYELLGNLRVVDGPQISSIGAQKIEILFATLLANADHVVSSSQLMNEIWGKQPPRRALAGLHVYVSELRKFLHRPDRAQSPIITRVPGYGLRLDGDELDSEIFLALAGVARRLVRERRYEEARESLEEALALWRGPALGDLGQGPVLSSFATRLTETRLECLEMLMDVQLERGRHREVIGMLYTITAENPLRETFHRQLMLALYRSERRADALKVYQSTRRVLIEELGLEPCTPMRELHEAILRSDVLEPVGL
ncbi:AfsR/SARP family transcriptional regulator [Streptomyces sp. WI04-05B]|uniref:AfsR/SARP family transcriptional regulator n=1 Tax=Streptomyces TaxID=1883 RepID=UPI0029A615A3|nr:MULTISPECIES: AfsR/SARP family transcriptional regulator [unclassified Streptomyces]MDX2548883.1 AfsR/SARP family transcriptional regulator [Streptomyces sp. WI04-05B]MDX2590500.1 AfsR/SARP family transcriptional regulator [Streptomyces sp. WI04-05A]MDX3751528.1 AfsR/SARP family transcriptional regulator [Streptomyces sp. AK08-02]